ncbi:B-cell differentiation antigen CD72 isoform 2 [Mus musculus]|jgi:CD72 antigen|uniref:B-cell differentiation antigen CD72 n=1 Tax=Mus musculus TaxID=10090 RepID=CD72_MOUSE|nr:B-cell differentiation antigen CD72 isoform 2 [Mus musculus]P21855.2 RecName: Full=B-cell differentiation antigen CD72; AltName: Full=Lyb-2; AltName: Full=Lymphocyte antigen 32; Short=Ly-32; AltName: CD_antigen=CD72 [Mus musculus]|eukprot:NP_031680.2 B-cell differentiation antigen CD72 isoform 2 [Mus musculus]
MADAITYADLRFVKVPLKNSASNHLGQDCEAYEDGELTYENVQVSPVPGGPPGLASPALADKAGVGSEQPTATWSSVNSSALRQIPRCPTVCLQYFLLGLLVSCLMLGVAVICLGVRYLQVSRQFQEGTRIWEATNSSLQQQLREKISQLGQKEVELQKARKELISSQDTLQEKQRTHEDAEQQLQACQAERAKTKENLKTEEERRRDLDQRLTSTRETLRRFFSDSSDTCCPCGWIPYQERCFYISHTLGSLEESQKYCTSLSSKLAAFDEPSKYYYEVSLPSGLEELLDRSKSYWIQMSKKWRQDSDSQSRHCVRIKTYYQKWERTISKCAELHPCICESEAFRFPDGINLN